MTKAEADLGVEVIQYTFQRLPLEERIWVVEQLQKQTRKARWNQITAKIRERAVRSRISQKEIDTICEGVRKQLYGKRIKSSN